MIWNKPDFTVDRRLTDGKMNDLSDGIDGILTGALPIVKAVTQPQADDSTNVATTAYVRQAIRDFTL